MSIDNRWGRLAAATMLLMPALARAQVTVAVDPTQNAHAISPLIYGMNFATADQIRQGGATLSRWGGNATTRYNYQIDVSNTANDYFFENVAGCWSAAGNYCSPATMDPMTNSGANAFFAQAFQTGVNGLFTIPTIGYVSKGPPPYDQPLPCGCPSSANSGQDSYDPYDTMCGNGQVGGAWITCPDPTTTTSESVTTQWTQDWVTYLVSKFGPSHGQITYELDNEPNLWSSTQHDVHPSHLTYDELWQRMQTNAVAILTADPTSHVAGFEEWGWPNYLCSDADLAAGNCSATSPDRAAHGGEELTAWILDQAAAWEQAHGQRILHALDLHYYPQGGNPPDNLRSLWDPAYTDPSWINATIELIPRMHDWVNQHYPGTLIGISEYQWTGYDTPLAVVTYAEVLGIFGREGLDYATAWSPPAPTDNAFAAFQLYRNYDGAGAGFQSTGVQATVTGSQFQAFASVGPAEMTVVLVNEGNSPVSATVTFGSFEAASVRYYEVSGTSIAASTASLAGGATLTVGATTAGILVVERTNPNAAPDAGVEDAGFRDAGTAFDGGIHDAGPSDAGVTHPDLVDGGAPVADQPSSRTPNGCGCSGLGDAAAVGLLALLLLRKRRHRVIA